MWRVPGFAALWTGQTVSAFGSYLTSTAIPLAALLVLGATPAQMGVLTALGAAPVLLVAPLAGVWVDRLPRRPLLIAADLLRAVLLLSLPLAAALHRLSLAQLALVIFLAGLLTVVAEIAGQAFLPQVIPPERLVAGNSALSASAAVAEIGGPSIAGVLVQAISAPFAISCDAVSFVISALCLARVPPPSVVAPAWDERRHMLREMADGLRFIRRHVILRPLAASLATFTFFGYFIGTLYVLFAIRTLHLPAAAVGTLVGLGGVSALVGSLVAERVVRRYGLGRSLIITLWIYGALNALIPLAGGPPLVAYLCMAAPQILGDAFIATHFIAQASIRQASIPDALRGRATATLHLIERGSGPIGALAAGWLDSITAPRLALAVGVAGGLCAPLWLLVAPAVRRLRSAVTS